MAEPSEQRDDAPEEKRGPPSAPEVGTRYSAKEIHDNIREEAEEELERPVAELLYSGVSAGMLIAFSFLAAAFLASLGPEKLRDGLVAAGYPLGFIFVVLARHQLFTENTLEPVLPFLEKRDRRTFGRLMRLWAIVLPANMLGALIIAFLMAKTQMLKETLDPMLASVANEGASGSVATVFYKAIFAGWLIAGMAWILGSTHDTTAQILLIWLTTAPIAAFGFKHSVAGAVEAFYRVAIGSAGWGAMLGGFIVPAVIGNVIGGVVLVAMVNHGQARGWSGS